jgi:hypothetical protein
MKFSLHHEYTQACTDLPILLVKTAMKKRKITK